MNSNKEAIQKKVAKMKVIREKVIRAMEDNLNERYLYISNRNIM